MLPLSSWGAGTRRLAALEVAAAHQVEHPVMVVDEIERGLESYRQRVLIEELIARPSQVFVTTHSAPAVSSAVAASLCSVHAVGTVGKFPAPPRPPHTLAPSTLLAH